MNTTTRKAIWFSRHQPSAAQIEDAARMGYALEVTAEGGKPTFEHRSFVGIGRISQESLRWLR